ncbi:MAG: helix-turn-helix transcriptional regulator [Gaiellaceae bacterium]
MTGGDRLLTLEQAADELGCSTSTIKRRIRAGAFPTFVDGRLVRVREADLRRYVLERVAVRARGVAGGTPSSSSGATVAQGTRLWD